MSESMNGLHRSGPRFRKGEADPSEKGRFCKVSETARGIGAAFKNGYEHVRRGSIGLYPERRRSGIRPYKKGLYYGEGLRNFQEPIRGIGKAGYASNAYGSSE